MRHERDVVWHVRNKTQYVFIDYDLWDDMFTCVFHQEQDHAKTQEIADAEVMQRDRDREQPLDAEMGGTKSVAIRATNTHTNCTYHGNNTCHASRSQSMRTPMYELPKV